MACGWINPQIWHTFIIQDLMKPPRYNEDCCSFVSLINIHWLLQLSGQTVEPEASTLLFTDSLHQFQQHWLFVPTPRTTYLPNLYASLRNSSYSQKRNDCSEDCPPEVVRVDAVCDVTTCLKEDVDSGDGLWSHLIPAVNTGVFNTTSGGI